MVNEAVKASETVLFNGYDIGELAKTAGYSEIYLIEVKNGYRPVTYAFRQRMAGALGRPAGELFARQEEGSNGER